MITRRFLDATAGEGDAVSPPLTWSVVPDSTLESYGARFGEGTLVGKRALLLVTVGGPEPHYAARGINGPIDALLFPIQHGILYYPGIEVLPPFVLYGVDRMTAEEYSDGVKTWEQRLLTL
nr:NAD(P)H-dependent oxidoreductase [Streptomyces noursei]